MRQVSIGMEVGGWDEGLAVDVVDFAKGPILGIEEGLVGWIGWLVVGVFVDGEVVEGGVGGVVEGGECEAVFVFDGTGGVCFLRGFVLVGLVVVGVIYISERRNRFVVFVVWVVYQVGRYCLRIGMVAIFVIFSGSAKCE